MGDLYEDHGKRGTAPLPAKCHVASRAVRVAAKVYCASEEGLNSESFTRHKRINGEGVKFCGREGGHSGCVEDLSN